ncbi:MAG: hypothetical protein ACRD3E_14760, partial [Terriglobales bacterium]
GRDALIETCDDQNQREDLRLKAARQLIELGDDKCVQTVSHLLDGNDSAHRREALELARMFHHLSELDAESLSDRVAPSLSDADPSIRIAASAALAALGRTGSSALIETALSVERDPSVRTQMYTDLVKLHQKKTVGP